MKKTSHRTQHRLLFGSFMVVVVGALLLLQRDVNDAQAQGTIVTAASYSTSGSYSWTVPAGLTSITITARGAGGGASNWYSGGPGGYVQATLTVTPGETLEVRVGGPGGTGGSYSCSAPSYSSVYAGGGGGYSGLFRGTTPLVIAGGGGGAGGSVSNNSCSFNGSSGGTGGSGGGGAYLQGGSSGSGGGAGGSPGGGRGSSGSSNEDYGGSSSNGGGGGGYAGGTAGSSSGGKGGTSYTITGSTNIVTTAGGGAGSGSTGSVVITYDTAPSTSITAPTNGAALTGTVTLSANTGGAFSVVGVQFQLDGIPIGSEDTTAPYSISFNTTALAGDGAHVLTAVVRNVQGVKATSAPVNVTIDNGYPAPTPSANTTASSNAGYITGYAWSDNIGWIDFSPGVYVSADDGVTLGGWAWNDNVGWISFNQSDFTPVCSGTCKPRLTGSKGNPGGSLKLAGWVRACSGTQGSACEGAARTDGWDGWINLGQSASNASPSGSSSGSPWTLNGYAWGSDVVGWVSYSGAGYGAQLVLTQCNDGFDNNGNSLIDYKASGGDPRCSSLADTTEDAPPVLGNFSALPTNVRKGGSTTLSWNGVQNVSACRITTTPALAGFGAAGVYAVAVPPDTGTTIADNLQQNTTFTLECQPDGGGAWQPLGSKTVNVTPVPQIKEI